MKIQELESRLHQLLPTLNLKPTLERAAEIGDVILEAKANLPHGEFGPWLRRFHLKVRTAWDYMAVSKARKRDWWPATTSAITIKQFLRYVRQSFRSGLDEDREAARLEVAANRGCLPDRVSLTNADCRKHRWPSNFDAVVADPPWADMDAYNWVADFAGKKLKPGGLLFVQSGTHQLPRVMAAFDGLTYAWTMAITYKQGNNPNTKGGFVPNWCPVLVYTNGSTPKKIGTGVSDTYTVTKGDKTYHGWQQPADAWNYWLSRLIPSGAVVADPFAGSGTIGVVCAELGLTYHGTEKDKAAFEVARGRLFGAPRSDRVK